VDFAYRSFRRLRFSFSLSLSFSAGAGAGLSLPFSVGPVGLSFALVTRTRLRPGVPGVDL
jgi:hypothetical protein